MSPTGCRFPARKNAKAAQKGGLSSAEAQLLEVLQDFRFEVVRLRFCMVICEPDAQDKARCLVNAMNGHDWTTTDQLHLIARFKIHRVSPPPHANSSVKAL
jgi:hypothetical protein